jgi:hydroxymethylpyrimidine/phosphomethylpyrimidine kinase
VTPTSFSPAPPNVVSIAGIDPSGGAGILADIKTFSALGVYGCAVATALTAQNTLGVSDVHVPPVDFLRQQIDTLFSDLAIAATKIGMLGHAQAIATVADGLTRWQAANVVLDPVMVAKSGSSLLAPSAIATLREALFPLAFIITPNLPEAAILLSRRAAESVHEMYRMAEALRESMPVTNPRWVLLKGGHLPGNDIVDLLFDGDRMIELPAQRIASKNTHGTGCTLSSAIAALLPRMTEERHPVESAVRAARDYLYHAIFAADRLVVGHGHGPVHHFHHWWNLPPARNTRHNP